MLRLPILTSQLSKSLSSTPSTVHNLFRAGLKHPTQIHSCRILATMSTQSKACCTVPPVVSEGYKEKGEWITINGMKTYATGPKDAQSALLVIFDIFGHFSQTLQGADILAHSDKDHQYQVFMPGEYHFPRMVYIGKITAAFGMRTTARYNVFEPVFEATVPRKQLLIWFQSRLFRWQACRHQLVPSGQRR
jgi:hypothetical protein